MQFITLDTVDDPRVEAYVSLTEMQLRNRLEPAKGVFIAESPKVIDRALAADREPLSLLVEEPWLEGMKDTFDFIDGRWGADIPVYVASPEQLKRLTGYRLHRGALCAMRRWPLPSVAEVCRSARRVAVMENIVDHTNVGALMRSAAALDVDAVLVTPSCGDPLYRRAARVSMGTVFQIPWTRITGFICTGHILRVEVGFDLLGQLQPGFVLRVSVGVHQDGGGCMASVALHRLEVTARLQQLVGGTGVAQTVEHDLLKLRVLCPPHTIPLGQNVRGNG